MAKKAKTTSKATTAKKETKKKVPEKKSITKSTSVKKETKKKVSDKKSTTKSTTPKKETKKKVSDKKSTTPKKETKKKVSQKKQALDDRTEKKVSASKVSDQNLLGNFNWHNYEEGIDLIDEKQLKEFELLVDKSFNSLTEDEIIEGEVVHITDREAIIDINSKSEGVISLNEFRYNPDLKVGDKVEVLIDVREDKTGQLILSHRKARTIKAWDRVNAANKNGEIVKGHVKCRTKGGMIVDVFGIEAFLPGSQIDVKPIRDYDQYVNKVMEFKVVKINHEFKNVVVSHKALIEADIEEQKKEIISQLEKGQILEGIVKNITSYGVFIDLGGVDGLIHITDLSWTRINHPSEILELDQKLRVVILDFDDDKSRIQLGLKQLSSHPWDNLDKNLKEGDKVKGKVVVIADYGAFIEIEPGVEGLIHVSRLANMHITDPKTFVKKGDELEAIIIDVDKKKKRIALSHKEFTDSPWTGVSEEFPEGTIVKGIARRVTDFGVYVELKPGIDGLLRTGEISWTKRFKKPSEVIQKGQEIEVMVVDINETKQTATLSIKRLSPSPWPDLEKDLAEGTVLKGKVVQVMEQGCIVNVEGDIDAFMPKSKARPILKGNKLPFDVGSDIEVVVADVVSDDESLIIAPKIDEDVAAEFEQNQKNRQNRQQRQQRRPESAPRKSSEPEVSASSFSFGDLLSDKAKDKLKNLGN